jgi:tRNA 2-thiouridine synthesizing protein C
MDDDKKKILFLMRKPPHGSNYAYGGLDAMLMVGAYEQEVSVVFMDDGVYTIKKGQDTSEIDVKEFSVTFRALSDHDVEKLYIEKDSMESRGLNIDDFVVTPEVIEASEVAKLMLDQDVILPF